MSLDVDNSVCVIIVNYNGGDFVRAAVEHLKNQSRPPDEVIVIDNASADGSADGIDIAGLPKARLVRLDTNTGFARANNIAAEMTNCTWLALLNPDTEPSRDWLCQLLNATSRHPNVNMFASAQIDANDHNVLDGAGDAYFVLGIPWRGGFGRKRSEMPGEGECFSPCGASALFRRDLFLKAGGFDESYFCYCEDVDLGFRLRLLGERCIFVPRAVVYHHGSAISGRYSDFTVRLGTRNRMRTYLTSMPLVPLLLTLPLHALATLYLYLRVLGRPHARATRVGVSEALAMLREILRRRRQVQATRTASTRSLLRAMAWNPLYLHSRRTHVWAFQPKVSASRA